MTGLGAVTPLGVGVETFWDRVRRGEVGTRRVTRFEATRYRSDQGGEVDGAAFAGVADSSSGATFALAAVDEACSDAGLPRLLGSEAALYLGSVFGTRPELEARLGRPSSDCASDGGPALDEICSVIAHRRGISGPVGQLSMACASGNAAIIAGCQAIRRGRAVLAIVGGVEELAESMFMMFSSMRALSPDAVRPFDRHRQGLILAEGAAVLVLEDARRAEARGAHPYCEVGSGGSVCEAFDMVSPEPSGAGAIRAMRNVLRLAGEDPGAVDYVAAHGTGTPANDAAEARAIAAVFPQPPKVSALKSMLGHMQGAAGAVGAVASVLSIRDGVVPPTPTLRQIDPDYHFVVPTEAVLQPVRLVINNAYGFGGNVSSVLFRGWP